MTYYKSCLAVWVSWRLQRYFEIASENDSFVSFLKAKKVFGGLHWFFEAFETDVKIEIFRFLGSKILYWRKNNFPFQLCCSFKKLSVGELENYLADKYFTSDYKFRNIFFTRTRFGGWLGIPRLQNLIIVNPTQNVKNFRWVGSSLTSLSCEVIYEVIYEVTCNYLEFVKFLIWKFLGI